MSTTDDDFKEITGPDAIDVAAGDLGGIVEIDEDEAVVVEADADPLEADAFGLNGRPKEADSEETDDDDYSAMEELLMEANQWEER